MSDTASITNTDSVTVTTITTTSISLTTSPTTTITITDTSTSTPDVPTTSSEPTTITSITSEPTSTTTVIPTSQSVIDVTSTTTLTPTTPTTSLAPTTPSVIVVTSTQQAPTSATDTATRVSTTSKASPTQSALSASGSGSGSGGLSSGGKIAIAVIIPIVVIAAAFLIGFFFWRKRKNRKNNEELRKNEMAEYGFNPNGDATLAGGAAAYTDNASEGQDDNGGYRGWGATSSNRKTSTTLGSNSRAPAGGVALSDNGSQPGGYAHGSPNAASDHYSADPLMNGHPEGVDGVAALGAAGGLSRNRSGAAGIRRGPSNASSTYSEGHVSELSSDNHSVPGQYYQEEVPYNIYNDAAPSHGPYGDGSYGGTGAQPVIRDVQARRNTRIERAPTFPQNQGGISQNF